MFGSLKNSPYICNIKLNNYKNMKQELINQKDLFRGNFASFKFVVLYREYYQESELNTDYINGLNPHPEIVEGENADYFNDLSSANARLKELKKIKKYHNIRMVTKL
jgi:hypothetical protein